MARLGPIQMWLLTVLTVTARATDIPPYPLPQNTTSNENTTGQVLPEWTAETPGNGSIGYREPWSTAVPEWITKGSGSDIIASSVSWQTEGLEWTKAPGSDIIAPYVSWRTGASCDATNWDTVDSFGVVSFSTQCTAFVKPVPLTTLTLALSIHPACPDLGEPFLNTMEPCYTTSTMWIPTPFSTSVACGTLTYFTGDILPTPTTYIPAVYTTMITPPSLQPNYPLNCDLAAPEDAVVSAAEWDAWYASPASAPLPRFCLNLDGPGQYGCNLRGEDVEVWHFGADPAAVAGRDMCAHSPTPLTGTRTVPRTGSVVTAGTTLWASLAYVRIATLIALRVGPPRWEASRTDVLIALPSSALSTLRFNARPERLNFADLAPPVPFSALNAAYEGTAPRPRDPGENIWGFQQTVKAAGLGPALESWTDWLAYNGHYLYAIALSNDIIPTLWPEWADCTWNTIFRLVDPPRVFSTADVQALPSALAPTPGVGSLAASDEPGLDDVPEARPGSVPLPGPGPTLAPGPRAQPEPAAPSARPRGDITLASGAAVTANGVVLSAGTAGVVLTAVDWARGCLEGRMLVGVAVRVAGEDKGEEGRAERWEAEVRVEGRVELAV
ncbi:hypothetical protein EJ06DRAFT_545922 [Trichodelitschia bisporula]|uniref:Uncharacterized protein n=1 Tax=Trichodelitschia bisporula TaxID=703511 RepID=A0A6G1IAV1_9PEZI|nr:hypothetical protein EJ06DRAFT_545922 [Trichodelitschia bisporula]